MLVTAPLARPVVAAAGECPAGTKPVPPGHYTLADGSAQAEVAAFCLDEGEVTVNAYADCLRRGRCDEAGLRCGRAATWGAGGKGEHPVNCVTWDQADRFCRAQGKRLPTEAEWEWAARGRLRALTYPWGTEPPADRACWDGVGNTLGKGLRNETCAVGAHPRGDSPDGFHDLGGNVREWTATKVGRDRVVRGGSWGDSLPEFLAAGFRGMNKPDERFEITGFRCASDPGVLFAPTVTASPAGPKPEARPAAVRSPPSARTPKKGEDAAEEEGVVVAPAEEGTEPEPAVARAEPPPPPPPPPPKRRDPVEYGEVKIESLSGSERK
jgi:hypothetical protein